MTYEEIESYENEIEYLHNRLDIAEYDKERLREEVTNLETKIKALEQEPCEDCISRAKLIQKLDAWDHNVNAIPNYVWKVIRELPPVNPQEPKTGHWEYVQYDGNPNIGNWHCSECRAIVNYEPTYNWEEGPYHKFCPMCGAKMQEVKG